MRGLNTSPRLRVYIPHLSNLYSIGALDPLRAFISAQIGCVGLFSGVASRLDAFSVYRLPRSYPAMPGRTTGTPVATPRRSSRTQRSLPSDQPQLQQIVTKLARTVLNPTNESL